MRRRKLSESLTARIFLITLLILLGAGSVTFGLIAWATPSTYTAVVTDDLAEQVDVLVKELAGKEPSGCGPALDEFILASGANAMLVDPDGRLVETVELPGRAFHLGAQFHPEFKSRPNRAHPLFKGFIAAALKFRTSAQRSLMHL